MEFKMDFKFFIYTLICFWSHTYTLAQINGVPKGCSMTFAKVAGFAPRVNTPLPVLHRGSYGAAITPECYNSCKAMAGCMGFVIEYAKNTCYQMPLSYNSSYVRQRMGLVPDPGVSFFTKVCLPVPSNCTNRAWVVEYTPGYELIGLQHTVLVNIDDRWKCSSMCLNMDPKRLDEGNFCLSADFHSWSQTCTLSSHTKWTNPDSFIPTTQRVTEYIENQCIKDVGPFCWHDPVYNQSSIRTDLVVSDLTLQLCRERCETNVYFTCRAFSFLAASHLSKSQCHLHSDVALVPLGPTLYPLLTQTKDAVYVERISCVNMSVTCDADFLTVSLYSPKFSGRLYVEDHSTDCGTEGRLQNLTVLQIPISNSTENKCGVTFAHALTRELNKTLVTTVVVVQYHQLIQTVQDRVIKVSCLLTEGGKGTPPSKGGPNNITVATSVTIANPPVQSEVTGHGTETYPTTGPGTPKATMKIIDPRTGNYVQTIQVGDPLRLEIHVDRPYNVSMVRAGHLVASSGTNHHSLLLLDWRGCPPEPKVFPGLTMFDPQTLVAEFKAFKFPSSAVLMLSVVLTFCPNICEPTDCGNSITSYGRKKRTTDNIYEEMPLQVVLVVRESECSTINKSDPFISITNSPLAAGMGETASPLSPDTTGEVCISFLMMSLLFLFWLLVQCVIMALCCWYLGKREKEHADTISLRRDFHPSPPSHHVTWADQQDTSTPRLRLSTPT